MTLLQVQPDTVYGQAYKNVAFLVDYDVFEKPDHVAMKHVVDAAKEDIMKAITHFGKQKWDVDTSRKVKFFKSPLQMDVDSLPSIDTFTRPEERPAAHVNDLLYRTGKVQMIARVYFKRVPLEVLPREEILPGEDEGFVNREEIEATTPDHHKTWKVNDDGTHDA